MMETSQSEILRQILSDGSFTSIPNVGSVWPCFVGHLPDGGDMVDNAICIYDEQLEKNGRLMRSGETILHYAVQILLRTTHQDQGWLKLSQIANYLDSLVNLSVTVGSDSFVLLSATQRQGINALGIEDREPQRRFFFDAKYILSIKDI